jgi:hypothetical protein
MTSTTAPVTPDPRPAISPSQPGRCYPRSARMNTPTVGGCP